MLKAVSFTFLLLCCTTLFAQNQRKVIDSLYRLIEKAPENEKATLYTYLADEYTNISGDTTIYYVNKALQIAERSGDRKTIAKALIIQGTIEKNQAAYPIALEHFLESLKITEELGLEENLARTYNSIGIIYKKTKRWDEALAYYKKSNEQALKHKQYKAASYTFNNIGTIYLEKEEWSLVEANYDSAIKYAEKANDNRAMATVLYNMGDLYRAQKKYNKALNVSLRCLKYDKANEDQYGMYMSYFQIARVYEEMRLMELSSKYADSAEHIAIIAKMNRERIDLYGWRSNVQERLEHYKQAFDYYRKSRSLRDTMLTETTARQLSELQTEYETEKKEQQIALQKSELSRKNYIIFSISGLLLLGLLSGYFAYSRYKLTQQAKLQKAVLQQQELATQAVIEAEERERKRIAGDLHDGVGQVMSAARMNMSVISNEIPFANDKQRNAFDKAMALVDEGCKEVRNVSHNIMPNALLKMGLASAIRDFVQKIDHRALEVNLYTEGLNERLSSNIEIVLYRVVQECVNNVIKHSGANTLDITLLKDEDGISITIEDNGKGFDINEAKKKEGIGLQNLQTRINYLKGTIEWDTASGKGTVVTINVPEV